MKAHALVVPAVRSRTLDYVALAKPRLNLLVAASAMAGYYLGAGEGFNLTTLIHAALGTVLVAAGASAFNQLAEQDVDGLMPRTRMRPLPDGRLLPAEARRFGIALSAIGLAELAVGASLLAALLAFATLASYTVVYTPLKRRTSLSTVVGAVPGALPPVIGWSARGDVSGEAWLLFAIVFLWQMPHFLAIAWLHREEYERAGIPLLPVLEPDGRSTARQVLAYSAALVPVSLGPVATGLAGGTYGIAAALLGLAFVALSVRFALTRSREDARLLFLGSITYLPLLWIAMVLGRTQF